MSLIRWIIILILVVVAFAHFFPDKYDGAREDISDKIKSKSNDRVAERFQKISDISKDPKDFICKSDLDCKEFFGINNLLCKNKKCVVE